MHSQEFPNTFNTLDRALSVRYDHSNQRNNTDDKNISDLNKKSKNIENDMKRMKYVETDMQNFKDFYSFGNRLGQNYNTNQENDLRFSESTRRKSIPKPILKNVKKPIVTLDKKHNDFVSDRSIMNLVNNDDRLRPNNDSIIMTINSNLVSDTAAKIPKASLEYWDNTKRRNLDTSIYTNNPMKIQGRGFGDINSYDIFFNGIGQNTRQDNPDDNPRNIDDDRIFLTNHNYHYDKHHVTEFLPCGADTRYLNKKMV
jgi:hypothetical protein